MEIGGEAHQVAEIEFWDSDSGRVLQKSATPLPEDSPEALLWVRPKALAQWTESAPLKLVAAALSASGGSGKVADIRGKLAGRVIEEGQWDNWWKKRTKALGNLPAHFESTKSPKGNEYRLVSSVDEVPADWSAPSKSKPVPLKAWREWLQAGSLEEVPGRYPTKPVVEALAKWDDGATIEQVLIRLAVSAEAVLSKGEVSAQEAENWLAAIAQAAIRRRETGGTDPRGYDAARAGEVLARLSRIAGDRTPHELLLEAGALDGDADAWRRGFLAGMWESFEGDDARELYLRSSGVLGRQARGDLAREMGLAAFGPDISEQRHPELDRLLDTLPESQRDEVLREVIASAALDQKEGVLSYIADTRHASGDEHLTLRILAVLLLSGGEGQLVARTSWELAESLASPDAYGPEVEALYENTAARVQGIISFKAGNLEELKEAHEAELERERQEQDRLRQQVRERNAELAANREESRLELRQDMLLAIGEVLQSVRRRGNTEELAGNVEAGLTLALRAGGAEPLGAVGETAAYNPEHHSFIGNAPEGGMDASGLVSIVAPGVIARGAVHGDRVLLKAQVTHEAG